MLFVLGLILAGVAAGAFVLYVKHLTRGLPPVFRYEDYLGSATQSSYVLGADGSVLKVFSVERRTVVPKEDMPRVLVLATVAAEDADFFAHEGIDYVGIARAMWKNIRARRFKQGASTITQQVARTFFLSQEKKLERKLKEAVLALELERKLDKDEIIALYPNQIYFGHGRYGAEEASRFYFGRPVRELGLAEAALLAGVINSPERLTPYRHAERAERRRAYVLRQMIAKGFVDQERGRATLEAPLGVLPEPPSRAREAPYYVDAVRRRVVGALGKEALYRGGLKIHTALRPRAQEAAEEAVRAGLARVDAALRVWRPQRHFDENLGHRPDEVG